jgi:hypothetical protein
MRDAHEGRCQREEVSQHGDVNFVKVRRKAKWSLIGCVGPLKGASPSTALLR